MLGELTSSVGSVLKILENARYQPSGLFGSVYVFKIADHFALALSAVSFGKWKLEGDGRASLVKQRSR